MELSFILCAYKVITSCNQVSLFLSLSVSLSRVQDETNLINALAEEGNLP